jgi:hypothetical protein
VCSAWEVHVVLRHVGTQTGSQNEKTASSGKAKEVEKGHYSAVQGEAAGVEVAGW